MKVTSIESRRLHRLIRKEFSRCLVLDCRPYLPFSASSVRGSINVNLNSVLLRRAQGGAAPLHFVVPEEGARCRLRDGQVSVVVVLDERSQRWQKLKKESPAHIVINTLSNLPGAPRICFLKGECPGGIYYYLPRRLYYLPRRGGSTTYRGSQPYRGILYQ